MGFVVSCSDGGTCLPCGPCRACCIVYALAELDKPKHTPCRHLCDTGCAIHDQPREEVCTGFYCSWAEGLLGQDEIMRPDQSGMIVLVEGDLVFDPPRVSVSSEWKHDDTPKLWTCNCVTRSAFMNPLPHIAKWIYRKMKAKHLVAMTWSGDSTVGRIQTKCFSRSGEFNEQSYLRYRYERHHTQFDELLAKGLG